MWGVLVMEQDMNNKENKEKKTFGEIIKSLGEKIVSRIKILCLQIKENLRYKKARKRSQKLYKRHKKTDSSRILFIYIVVAVTLIGLANFAVLAGAFFSKNGLSSVDMLEGTFLSTGLSIIGIAISVWAGLNIIQLLGRNRLNEIVDQYSKLEDERRELYKNQFINELKQQDRASSKYFCVRFRSATNGRDDIPASVYHKLYILESNYESVYLKGTGRISEVEVFNSTTLSEEVTTIINEISASNVCERNYTVVHEYLKSRVAELNYNFSYGSSNQPLLFIIDHCENTIFEYSDMYHLNICTGNIDNIDSDNRNIVQYILAQTYSDVNDVLRQRYVIHVLNLLADTYSRVAHLYLKKQNSDELKARKIGKELAYNYAYISVYLYEKLLTWAKEKDLYLNEFIYRNYAAALERKNSVAGFGFNYEKKEDKETINIIRENYKKAFELERETNGLRSTKDSVFKTNGSLYVKVIGKMDIFSLPSEVDKFGIEQWTDEIIEYMKTAILLFPQKLEHYKVLGIALSYKLGFIINRHDMGSIERYYYQIIDIKKKLEMEAVKDKDKEKDDYTKLLEANFEKIKNRL